MAQPATSSEGGNVLTTLDERVPTSFYWQLTLLATLGGFLFGYDTSNIGSALNFVPYGLHGLALGYLVSGASLGAAAGAILAGPTSDHFGRKTLLVVDAGIYAAGAILSAVTPDAPVLLFARTLIGLAIGADSAIATAYIAEYAPRGRRGSLTMLQQWMITIGILIAYIIALIIFSAFPHSAASVGWRLVLGLGAVPALIGLVLRTQMPESPRWLLRHGRYEDVQKAMKALGTQASMDDVGRAATVIERVEGDPRRRRLAWTPGVRRALIVVSVFFIASFAVGVGGTGWTLQGEVFPTAVRGQAAAFCAMIDWLANFLLIEVFPVWQGKISLAGVLVCFAGLAALAIVFVWKFLPETKALPVEEIVQIFERQPQAAGTVSAEHAGR